MFTWFDTVIFSITSISAISGIYHGVIKLIIGLLGFLSSIIATYYLYPYIIKISNNYFDNYLLLTISSVIISYIISLIICSLLTNKFLSAISTIRGGIIDRSLGLAAGVARGLIISICSFIGITVIFSDSYIEAKTLKDVIHNASADKYPEWLKKSSSTAYLNSLSNAIINSFPQKFLESIKLSNKLDNLLDKPASVNISQDLEEGLNEIFSEKANDNN